VKYLHLYADAEGESHFEDVAVPATTARSLVETWTEFMFSDPIPVETMTLVDVPPDPGDPEIWHPAPQRYFAILIKGELEMEASDGEKRRVAAGDLMLLEDTTGKGHRTRELNDGGQVLLLISAPQDAD
jgi:quercetin dioxygenase-like cupin family protein